jgi:signal transduction histidine kinase
MLTESRRTNTALENAKRELTSEIGERVQVERELREQVSANRRLLNRVSDSEATLAARMVEQTRQLTATQTENERLRVAAARVAVAAERSRLAGELHDSVAQAIFSIALSARTLQALKDAPGSGMSSASLTQPLDHIVNLSEGALAEIRALMFELRPDSLEAEGLLAALRKQATAVRARHGINLRTELGDEEPNVSLAQKELLYRAAVVALYGMVKYARASSAILRTHDTDEALALHLSDDGPGITGDAAALRTGELQEISQQARQAGGELHLTQDATGTALQIWLPKPQTAAVLPTGHSRVPAPEWVAA